MLFLRLPPDEVNLACPSKNTYHLRPVSLTKPALSWRKCVCFSSRQRCCSGRQADCSSRLSISLWWTSSFGARKNNWRRAFASSGCAIKSRCAGGFNGMHKNKIHRCSRSRAVPRTDFAGREGRFDIAQEGGPCSMETIEPLEKFVNRHGVFREGHYAG